MAVTVTVAVSEHLRQQPKKKGCRQAVLGTATATEPTVQQPTQTAAALAKAEETEKDQEDRAAPTTTTTTTTTTTAMTDNFGGKGPSRTPNPIFSPP